MPSPRSPITLTGTTEPFRKPKPGRVNDLLIDLMVWLYLIVLDLENNKEFHSSVLGPVTVSYANQTIALVDSELSPDCFTPELDRIIKTWTGVLLDLSNVLEGTTIDQYRIYLSRSYLTELTPRQRLLHRGRFASWAREHGLNPADYGVRLEAIDS